MPTNDYIRWFSDIRLGDVALVGRKNASLGQLYSMLSKEGAPPTPGSGCTSSLTSSTSGASTFSPSGRHKGAALFIAPPEY